MWGKLARHWFFGSIAICLIVGFAAADGLRPLRENAMFRDSVVFIVMMLMGLSLHPAAIRNSFRRPLPSLVAIFVNIIGVPLLAIPFGWVLAPGMYGGLAVAALVPCSLASASVWTRRAGGDDSIAIFTTVVTNLACVVVVPIGMSLLLRHVGVEISALAQMEKLTLIVVLPIFFAQLIRVAGAAVWADRNKVKLSFTAQFGILVMVLLGAAAGADSIHREHAASERVMLSFWISIPVVVAAAAAIHLAALLAGIMLTRQLGGDRREQIAVGISGSQKTLMVGLQIAIDAGVSVLPMIIYHITQLVLDTIVADRWKSRSVDGSTSRNRHVG